MTTVPAPMPGPGVRRRPADRKDMIVTAARRLAVHGGFAAVSMEDLASSVGVTPGALYRHFPGKDDIARAALADSLDRLVVTVEPPAHLVRHRDRGATDRALSLLVDRTVALALDDPTVPVALLRAEDTTWTDALRDRRRQLLGLWRDVVEAALPGLPFEHVDLRQRAVLGALGAMSGGTTGIARTRLEVLLGAAVTTVLVAPVDGRSPTPASPAITDRGWRPEPTRREQILAAAVHLFRERGFAGTSVDDIGRAVGIAASGVYRSYQGKADILLDAYDRAAARLEVGAEAALRSADSPSDALRRLASAYATVAVDNADLIVVTSREWAALSAQDRPRLLRRNRAVYDSAVSVLLQSRTDLSAPEAHLLVRGVMALANEVALCAKAHDIDAGRLERLMLRFLLAVPEMEGAR